MSLIGETVGNIVEQDADARQAARDRLEQLSMPHWALGRVMDLAVELAGMTRQARPRVARKTLVLMAADHGVTAEGVSRYPPEVTLQMVRNFARGRATINVLARLAQADVVVVDMGVAGDLGELAGKGGVRDCKIRPGTSNMLRGPAMTRQEAVRSVEAGIMLASELASATDVFAVGEMGIGNTTAASAIVALLSGLPAAEVTGRGAGLGDDGLQRKIKVIEGVLAVNHVDAGDALDVLAKVGGFEIGGLAGVMIGAAARGKPVILDGFITGAAALIAHGLAPLVRSYLVAAHTSVEPGHRHVLDRLALQPLLHLGLRLGEGTGAALAMNLVDAAVRMLTEVATFAEASVSEARA